MTGSDTEFAVSKILIDQVCVLEADVQQIGLSGGLIVRNARFVKMAQVIEFVAEYRVVEPSLLIDPLMRRRIGLHRAEGVKIAIRLLGGGDPADNFVEPGLQRRILLQAESERGSFDGLINVSIVEGIDRERRVLEVRLTGCAAVHRLGGKIKIAQPLGFLALRQRVRDGDKPVGFLPRLPETACDPHVSEGNGLHWVVGAGCLSGRAKNEKT